MFPSPPDAASILVNDLGILIGLMIMTRVLDRSKGLARAIFGATTAALIVSYTVWRWHDTLPRLEPSWESAWQYTFFFFEALSIAYTLMSIVILLRQTDRSAEADMAQARLVETDQWPAVDIFICTYNEPLPVLERSILPALALDYPGAVVWVLDDTRRPWLKDFCDEVGARYLTRADNIGAKAGNLNNALRLTETRTNAPLILVLDADFAPHRHMLKRMVGLFGEPRTAVVQTPQFFYNADPIQHNLLATTSWVDDQRIFFDVFQPAKDAWGCAFCVGTSFIVRRDRLNEIGGFPQAAICEDINLSYTLMSRGYETHWLNEKLSVGLSAEGLPEYITQRTRWCLGTIQVALLKNGPFFGRGYTLMQRAQYLHGVLNWFCKPFILLMLMAPALYWLLGLPAFQADYLSFLHYGLPALLALWTYSYWVSGSRTLPLFMEVTHSVTALAVTMTLATALVKPFGRPFKVTDKGGDRSQSTVRWKMALLFGGNAVLSGTCVVWFLVSPATMTEIAPLDFFNLLWAGISMVFCFVSFLVCFEQPRDEDRFIVEEPAFYATAENEFQECGLVALSTTGATVRAVDLPGSFAVGEKFWFHVTHIGWIAAAIRYVHLATIDVRLEPTPEQHRDLVVRLFATPHDHVAPVANLPQAVLALFRRCFKAA